MTEKRKATTLLILVVLIIIAAVGLVAANNRASYDTGEATAGITPPAFSTTPTK